MALRVRSVRRVIDGCGIQICMSEAAANDSCCHAGCGLHSRDSRLILQVSPAGRLARRSGQLHAGAIRHGVVNVPFYAARFERISLLVSELLELKFGEFSW